VYAHSEDASRGKAREMDTCLAPALAAYGRATRRAHASRFFDVLKDASLRVARSDWTAARASVQNGQRNV
jgi:hypothetical protein